MILKRLTGERPSTVLEWHRGAEGNCRIPFGCGVDADAPTQPVHQIKPQNETPQLLSIVAAAAVRTGLQAAKITYEVQVSGYSRTGWVKIVPELRGALRGGVVYLPQHGGWVTDRVGRGELLRTTFVSDRSRERSGRGALLGIASPKGVINFSCTRLSHSLTERVSRDARLDNIFAWAITEAG